MKISEDTDPVAISKLFFETVKTVNGQFNVCLEPCMRIFLNILPQQENMLLFKGS